MKTESYKLYIGFRKLDEFNSICQAKQFARDSGVRHHFFGNFSASPSGIVFSVNL